MREQETTSAGSVPNNIVFCERPWKWPVFALAMLVVLTFSWGFYLLDDELDDGHFNEISVSELLGRNAAAPNIQYLYDVVPPAVVGIGGAGVNSDVVASGAIVSGSGYVLTTWHAVANLPAISVHVRTPTGIQLYEAQVVKTMPDHDLVLIKLLTQDRFLHFTLVDTQTIPVGEPVFGFGHGLRGNTVVKQGVLYATNLAMTAEGGRVSHLFGTDAVYSWEQSGGPLVNANGELVGINVALASPTGGTEGFAVPAHVIMAHFQDVVSFDVAAPLAPAPAQPAMPAASLAPAGVTAVPAATGPLSQNGGSAGWWNMARQEVAQAPGTTLGMNVAMPAGTTATPMVDPAATGAAFPSPAQMLAPAAAVFDPDHLLGGRIGGYPIEDILGLALLALVAGITGGMMTMGGGVIQVAGMMVFFGYGMYLIRPVAYLTNIFVYGAAALRNNRAGLVDWDNIRALVPWAIAGVVLGYFIGNIIGDKVVYYLLGFFALLMALKALHEIYVAEPEHVAPVEPVAPKHARDGGDFIDDFFSSQRNPGKRLGDVVSRNALLGMPMGLISGILGISGGVVEVPLQRYIGHFALRNAIANASVLVFWASVAGALVAFVHGVSSGLIEWHAPITLSLIMIPGAFLGGFLGAKLMKILPMVTLKWIYTAMMLAIAAKMLLFR